MSQLRRGLKTRRRIIRHTDALSAEIQSCSGWFMICHGLLLCVLDSWTGQDKFSITSNRVISPGAKTHVTVALLQDHVGTIRYDKTVQRCLKNWSRLAECGYVTKNNKQHKTKKLKQTKASTRSPVQVQDPWRQSK